MKLSIDYTEKLINIAIISEMLDNSVAREVEYSIISALHEDCEDALVIEGRSGIKKLKRMEQDNYIQGLSIGLRAVRFAHVSTLRLITNHEHSDCRR
jgi:hypothetical protein